VRRLGFVPQTIAVTVDSAFAPAIDVALTTLPIRLATVQVRSTRRVYTGYMADFNRRRDSNNGGHFFTREQIDSLHPYRTSDLLRRVPGMNLTPTGGGTGMAVRMRGQRCMPLVWVDGTPAVAGYFDPDLIDPRSIAGIEIYSGLGTVPPALTGPIMAGSCGTVAIWTRIPDPRRKNARPDEERVDPKQAATRLAALVDSLQVFTVTQVDEAVTLDSATRFAPQFPEPLRLTRRAGLVITEFVVDVEGRVELATVGVVSSTHPLFTAAVDSALASAVFHPARLEGRPVRQVVQLPVYFALPGKDGN
jgi:TonB family protein